MFYRSRTPKAYWRVLPLTASLAVVACSASEESSLSGTATGGAGTSTPTGAGGAASSESTPATPDTTAGGAVAAGTAATGGASSATGGTSAVAGTSTVAGGSVSTGSCTLPTDFDTPAGYAASVTGGGNAVPTTVATMAAMVTALAAYDDAGGTAGLVLYYTGTFDFSTIPDPCTQWQIEDEQHVDIKNVSNVSVIGAKGSSMNFGFHLSGATNVILRNLTIGLVPAGDDAIGVEGSSTNLWFDHNDLSSSMVECAGAGDKEFDGLIDIKDGSRVMTFSFNKFHDHHKAGLMGQSDTVTYTAADWQVTVHHNWYDNIGSRTPLQRGGTTHLFNNYYNNVMTSGINVRLAGTSLIEANYFENCLNPVTSRDSDTAGYWELRDNYVGGNITWSTSDDTLANAEDWSTTQAFTATLGYAYSPNEASCVKEIVTATAGATLDL